MSSTLPLYCDLHRTSNRDIRGINHIPVLFPNAVYATELIRLNFSSPFYFTRALDPSLRSAREDAAKISPYTCINVRMLAGRSIDAHHIRKPVRVRRGAHPLAKLPRGYI